MTLEQYAKKYPEKYAKTAIEANSQGKILKIEGNKLVLTDVQISIEEFKTLKKTEIDSKKQFEEYANIKYLNTEFQADADSQFKLSSAILIAVEQRIPNFEWFDAYNKKRVLSIAQLKELGFILMLRTSNLVKKARELKDKVDTATTKEEIEALTWE